MIKVGIIGNGGMGGEHARKFREIRGVQLHACFDLDVPRTRSFAKAHDIPHVASSSEELIAACDAISVVTPDAMHATLSLKVLGAGRHLLCEKPLTTTLADARRVARKAVKASERDGVVHMINFSYRNSSAVQEAIKLVREGRLGEIRHVHGSYLQSWLSSSVWGSWHAERYAWRLQSGAGFGGVLADLGCHLLDLVSIVAGDIESLDCMCTTFPKIDDQGRKRTTWRGRKLDANDTALTTVRFSGGAVGVCHTSRWATGHTNSIELSVHGTEGALRIALDDGFDKIHLCLGKAKDKAAWVTRTIRHTPSIYQRFIRAIRTGKQGQPDTVRGAQVQSYLDACQRSASKSGATTRIRAWL